MVPIAATQPGEVAEMDFGRLGVLPNPIRAWPVGSEEEQLAVYRAVRDAIRKRIERELLPWPEAESSA